MIGFFFSNRHSSDFWLAMEDARRPLLPAKRQNTMQIAGRDGTLSLGDETYETSPIPVDICFISDNVENLQKVAREIAHWLSGKGRLIFDDEPDKHYQAVVYGQIDTEQLIRFKRATVTFECQPAARSNRLNQELSNGIASGHTTLIENSGTHHTGGTIMITNTGNVAINNIRITRRALHR
ncbi:MAG: phage tail family protein [Oscillospiraceae bacterium]|nr:phage tail family protein [Oscillospiraceae bacterium]